ncbi:PREDICTED: porimin-like [Ceratotherium simum simum]|uniref:Porimin-like n=1 Tax=Ceratotherium simum simum TaxID=73337 RepID=A0ABM1CMF8_CERSS|nr:PREDICTED: porimin-like [Ceratotherium simum simum]
MGLGTRGGWAVLMLGALLLLALLKVAVDSSDSGGSPNSTVKSVLLQNSSATPPGEFKKVQEMDFHLSRTHKVILASKVHQSWYTELF